MADEANDHPLGVASGDPIGKRLVEDALAADDPVEVLANRVADLIFEDPYLTRAISAVALRSMGYDPLNTFVGGNDSDREEIMQRWWSDFAAGKFGDPFKVAETPDLHAKRMPPTVITEDEPRFETYWAVLADVHHQVLAGVISSKDERYRLSAKAAKDRSE